MDLPRIDRTPRRVCLHFAASGEHELSQAIVTGHDVTDWLKVCESVPPAYAVLELVIDRNSVRVGQQARITADGHQWYWSPVVTRIDHDIRAVCRGCGCTFDRACVTSAGPCWWAGIELCSGCETQGVIEVPA